MTRKVNQIIHTPNGEIVFDLECGHEISFTQEGKELGLSSRVVVSAMRYDCPDCQRDLACGGLGWQPKSDITNALLAEGAEVIMELRQKVKELEGRIKELER